MNVRLILLMNIIYYFMYKNTHTHIIYNCFDCFISIRQHNISLLIHLNVVTISQKYIDPKS